WRFGTYLDLIGSQARRFLDARRSLLPLRNRATRTARAIRSPQAPWAILGCEPGSLPGFKSTKAASFRVRVSAVGTRSARLALVGHWHWWLGKGRSNSDGKLQEPEITGNSRFVTEGCHLVGYGKSRITRHADGIFDNVTRAAPSIRSFQRVTSRSPGREFTASARNPP